MAKMSVLDIVQEILSDMDSDVVNSIFDTVESEQVASIVRSTYRSIIASKEWPHLKTLTQLVPYSDESLPTHMAVPEGTKETLFINYDCSNFADERRLYREVGYRSPDDFLRITSGQVSTQEQVTVVVDPSGVELLIRNDKSPTFWTTFDDKTVVFNSYDKSIEDSLQSSKSQALLYLETPWKHTDSFVPDLPAEVFPLLVEESKSRAFIRLKQMNDPKSEQVSREQKRFLSQKGHKLAGGQAYPDYGRGRAKFRRDPTFRRY